jgi:hypothetical protein
MKNIMKAVAVVAVMGSCSGPTERLPAERPVATEYQDAEVAETVEVVIEEAEEVEVSCDSLEDPIEQEWCQDQMETEAPAVVSVAAMLQERERTLRRRGRHIVPPNDPAELRARTIEALLRVTISEDIAVAWLSSSYWRHKPRSSSHSMGQSGHDRL